MSAIAGLMLSAAIVVIGYQTNLKLVFYDGLLAAGTLLILLKRVLDLRPSFILLVNTLILWCLALPGLELFYGPPARYELKASKKGAGTLTEKAYSYAAARGHPDLFRNWWRYYLEEWRRISDQVIIPDPDHVLPFRLKPGAEVKFAASRLKINRHGFRGAEFDVAKKDHYRIVALGESTTMGATLQADDAPWPEVLAKLIQSRLKCAQPVEVINAGVWAYTLENNLNRFQRDILPLKPDMILSYDGYNGFPLLDAAWAPFQPGPAPHWVDRPSYLLAKVEYHLKRWRFRRQQERLVLPLRLSDFKERLLASSYARLYRQLIALAETNRIKLVLSDFSLAVNENSPKAVIQFYAAGFPNVRCDMKANQLHNYLLSQIAPQNETVKLIHATANLDGHYDQFIDLVHFTQAGRNQLAEDFYQGIKGLLP